MNHHEDPFVKEMAPYARAIARKLLERQGLPIDDEEEEIANTLLLAGRKVWKETGDMGLAKHRMSDRAKNEAKRLGRVRKQPRALGLLQRRKRQGNDDTDATEAYHAERTLRYRRFRRGPASRNRPLDNMIVQEFIDRLPEQRRRVCQCRLAAMTIKEIAHELNISEKTVEREIAALKDTSRREFDL